MTLADPAGDAGFPAEPPPFNPSPAKPQPEPRTRVKVEPEPNSRLETLLTEWQAAKAAEDSASERANSLKAAIAWELQGAYQPEDLPDAFDIPAHPMGMYQAWSFTYVPGGKSLDRKALEAVVGREMIEPFLKDKRGYWALSPKNEGRRRR